MDPKFHYVVVTGNYPEPDAQRIRPNQRLCITFRMKLDFYSEDFTN